MGRSLGVRCESLIADDLCRNDPNSIRSDVFHYCGLEVSFVFRVRSLIFLLSNYSGQLGYRRNFSDLLRLGVTTKGVVLVC